MRKKIKAISIKTIVLTFGAGVLFSCSMDVDSPGLEYMPDMYRSPAIEPYVDYGWIKEQTNVELTKQESAMHPPIHTVAYRGNVAEEDMVFYLPYTRRASKFAPTTHNLLAKDGWNIGTTAEGDYYISAADKNPIKLTPENEKAVFEGGKKLYAINCAHCHGEKGDGNGPMVESGAYAGVPDYKNLSTVADGQMFYAIYYGKGMMGSHANLLSTKEIWTLVHYVDKLRYDNYGSSASDSTNVSDTLAASDSTSIDK